MPVDSIDRRRSVLEHRLESMRRIATNLQQTAELEKNNPNHGVHSQLKKALRTLAQREYELAKFNLDTR